MMVELDSMRVMRILADTTNRIAEGEVLQLLNIGNADTDERAYLGVIERKTAVLFSAATRLGAVLAGLPPEQEEALARTASTSGMHPDRRRRARLCLRCRHARQEHRDDSPKASRLAGHPCHREQFTEQAASLRRAIESGGLDSLDNIVAAIRDSGALEYATARAHAYAASAKSALAALPASDARDALAVLADYSVDRAS